MGLQLVFDCCRSVPEIHRTTKAQPTRHLMNLHALQPHHRGFQIPKIRMRVAPLGRRGHQHAHLVIGNHLLDEGTVEVRGCTQGRKVPATTDIPPCHRLDALHTHAPLPTPACARSPAGRSVSVPPGAHLGVLTRLTGLDALRNSLTSGC